MTNGQKKKEPEEPFGAQTTEGLDGKGRISEEAGSEKQRVEDYAKIDEAVAAAPDIDKKISGATKVLYVVFDRTLGRLIKQPLSVIYPEMEQEARGIFDKIKKRKFEDFENETKEYFDRIKGAKGEEFTKAADIYLNAALKTKSAEIERAANAAVKKAEDSFKKKLDEDLAGVGISRRVAFWAGIFAGVAALAAGSFATWTSYNTKEAARINAETAATSVASLSSQFERHKTEKEAEIAGLREDFKRDTGSLERRLADKEAAEARLEARVAGAERVNASYENRVKTLEDANKSFAEEQKKYFAYAQSIEKQTEIIKGDIATLKGLYDKSATKEEFNAAYKGLREKLDKLTADVAENSGRIKKYEDETQKRDESYQGRFKEVAKSIDDLRKALLKLEKIGEERYKKAIPEP